MKTIAEIVQEGVVAAHNAEQIYRDTYGEPWYCGFAWVDVVVERTNSKQAKELLAAGFRKSYKTKTLTFWNPGGSGTQSMDVKTAGANAMAKVLQNAGLNAYYDSRAD